MTGIAYSNREEWLALRRRGMGGSDAAAIIGVSPWSTAVDVWEDKLGISEDRPPTVAMEWGNRLEDVIADAVADRTGLRLRRVHRILVHPTRPLILGSLDREAPGRVVEIKTARSGDGWVNEDEIDVTPPERRVPPQYYVQGQHYLGVTGKPEILFGVLIGGRDLRVIPVPADPGFIEDLFTEEESFWTTYVETGIRPPLSGADAEKLTRIYPHGSGERVATPEIDQLVEELLRVRAEEDRIADHRAELEVGIKDYLGDASDLVSGVARVTWRESERTTVAWKDVAAVYRAALEEVAAAEKRELDLGGLVYSGARTYDPAAIESLYTTSSSSRTFRLDRKGAKG
jgi:putative phage-type endonuclease